jgi:Ca2+-binding RTX toxin-like protein
VDYSTSAVPVTVDLAAGTAVGEGTDTLVRVEDAVGSVHDDVIRGTDDANELNGNAGDDVLEARGGDDEIEGGPGDDHYDGGPGLDVLQFNLAPSGVEADLSTGTATGQGTDTLTGLENLTGTLFDDVLTGDDGPNVIDGAFGQDVVTGSGGNDVLLGDRGEDRLSGGDGDDVLDPGVGDDESAGDAGDDHLWSSVGADAHDGGPGADLIDFSLETEGVDVDLEAGTAGGAATDTVTGLEDVLGTTYADRIRGDGEANRVDAGKSIDEIDGRGGDDVLFGGSDRSRDFLAGGEGDDTADYTGASRRVVVDLQAGFSEGTGNDVLITLENVIGSLFDDDLRGDDLANVFEGNDGDDVMDVRGGDDTVDGGNGTDTADGGEGTDTCTVEFAFACE